jgi:hypothetical protein
MTETSLTPKPNVGAAAPAVVAFYLPQYHPIPENDEWWGEGFTDWVKVQAASRLFEGHPVPFVPSELGAYDLRDRHVRERQAELARSHGIYGFCYYWYWFGGRRLLEQPLESMLSDGAPDLPFCLCWANEPWSRRWDGRERDVLMPQHHDRVRDLAVLGDLLPYLEDERYIRIDGRPLLLIYRQGLLDDAPRFTSDLREEAIRRGLPGLYLCNVMSVGDAERAASGFDAAVEFPPNGILVTEIDPRTVSADPAFRGRIYDYPTVVTSAIVRPIPSFPYFPGVMPRWDNSARRGLAAEIFHGSTPQLFQRWLRHAASVSGRKNPGASLVFVNSWNEWAEGAHLEPDERTGRRYLEAVRRVVFGEAHDGHAREDPDTADGSDQAPGGARVVEPAPGLPEGVGEMGLTTASVGAAWIDSLDGRPFEGQVIEARPDDTLLMRGWFYGDPRRSGRLGGTAHLVLTGDTGVWHVPIRERHRRPDLLRAMLARDRRTRRLVRLIDRLPDGVGRRVLRLWASRDDHLGFELQVRLGSLPAGRYESAFVELTPRGRSLIRTELVFLVG